MIFDDFERELLAPLEAREPAGARDLAGGFSARARVHDVIHEPEQIEQASTVPDWAADADRAAACSCARPLVGRDEDGEPACVRCGRSPTRVGG